MKALFILGSILVPLLMFFVQMKWERFRIIFHIGAIVAALVFGNIATISVYQIIKDDTVMMTNIHGIFLNPYFLIAGLYLGSYLLYQLLKITMENK